MRNWRLGCNSALRAAWRASRTSYPTAKSQLKSDVRSCKWDNPHPLTVALPTTNLPNRNNTTTSAHPLSRDAQIRPNTPHRANKHTDLINKTSWRHQTRHALRASSGAPSPYREDSFSASIFLSLATNLRNLIPVLSVISFAPATGGLFALTTGSGSSVIGRLGAVANTAVAMFCCCSAAGRGCAEGRVPFFGVGTAAHGCASEPAGRNGAWRCC